MQRGYLSGSDGRPFALKVEVACSRWSTWHIRTDEAASFDGLHDILRGRLDTGASVTFNSSGPAKAFAYPNGDFEFRATGLFNGPGFLLSPSGEPEIFTSAGLLDVIFHPDGSITYLPTPHHIIDVCTALGLS